MYKCRKCLLANASMVRLLDDHYDADHEPDVYAESGLPPGHGPVVITQANDDIAKLCRYNSPKPEMEPSFTAVSEATEYMVRVLVANVPPSADRTLAIRHVLMGRMLANSAIIFEGVDHIPKD